MKMSEKINELATSLAVFQSNVKQPLKDKDNPFFKSKYVPLENVAESVTESAGPLGLSYVQFASNEEDKIGVATMIMHKSGQYIEFDPIYAKPAKNDPQGVGSAITYLKRYSLSAAFGITSDEDDDGNSNMQQPKQQYNKPQQQNNNKKDYPSKSNLDTPNLNRINNKAPVKQPMPNNAKEAQLLLVPDLFPKHVGKSLGYVWREDQPYLVKMVTHEGTPTEIVEGILLMQQAAAAKKVEQQG